MKNHMNTLLLILAVLGLGASVSIAGEARQEERVEHYAAQEIKNPEAAKRILSDENKKIHTVLEKKTLEVSDMEQIHEMSYTLEAAIDMLIKNKTGDKGVLEKIDESIQGLHYASEHHDAKETRKWSVELATALVSLQK